MADWQQISQGLEKGYLLGRSTGGRLAGLGQAISKVAERLRSERESQQELGMKRNILGMEEASKIRLLEKEAELQPKGWKPSTKAEALELAKAKRSQFGFWDEETGEVVPPVQSTPVLPPAPTGKFNPLRMFPGYASYGKDKRNAYNALRSRGISEQETKKRLGLQ